MECYTPMDFNITSAVKYGSDNEILIQVGDRAWLPSEAAGGTDKEKVHYLPGIWDDVFITATGKMRVDKILFLPSLAKGLVTVKTLVRSLYPPQMLYGDKMKDSCKICLLYTSIISRHILGRLAYASVLPRFVLPRKRLGLPGKYLPSLFLY